VPPNRSVIAEVYPALLSGTFPSEGRTADQQDAFAIGEWLQRADSDGSLERFLRPEMNRMSAKKAEIEAAGQRGTLAIDEESLVGAITWSRGMMAGRKTVLAMFSHPTERKAPKEQC
jgi:hypothetical protein